MKNDTTIKLTFREIYALMDGLEAKHPENLTPEEKERDDRLYRRLGRALDRVEWEP